MRRAPVPNRKAGAMKLITAIVQPQKLAEVIDAAAANGARGLTSSEVHGFGQQYGQQSSLEQAHWGLGLQAALLPKVRIDVVVPDDRAEAVTDAIAKCAKTGTIGDGKIWVSTVDSAVRVRTGERDDDAL
jgi:nitrogen regulatory protein PII